MIPALLLAFTLAGPAHAGDDRTWATVPEAARVLSSPGCRVALVIGNGAYRYANKLPGAVADARAIAAVLEGPLGFRVVRAYDADEQVLRGKLVEFQDALGPGCLAVVYYAGHGAQDPRSGRDYLIPVNLERRSTMATYGISVQQLRELMAEKGARVRVGIFDSCRTFTLPGEMGEGQGGVSVDEGLGDGSFTMWSTQSGTLARDDSGFGSALARTLLEPGLTVKEVFNRVQAEVGGRAEAGTERQVPEAKDLLVGDVYFLPPASLADAWRAVLALPEGKRRDAVLSFAQQHASSGAPEVGLAITWLKEHLGGGEKVVTVQAPAPAAPARTIGHQPGERMVSTSGIALRWVPATGPGGFTMGSDPKESGRDADEGPAQVALTEGRWVMESEVTQAMFSRHFQDPSAFDGDLRPVEQVTWCEAVAFADKLSLSERLTPVYGVAADFATQMCTVELANTVTPRAAANGYRLLTEAEWEWSARAGEHTRYAGGDELDAVAVHSTAGTSTVCSKAANVWGLCDMTGNVWEWVQDGYDSTLPGGTDPLVRTGSSRVVRGGFWGSSESILRVAYRYWISPGFRRYNVGFRLSRSD